VNAKRCTKYSRFCGETKLLQKRGYALPKILVNSNVKHVKPVGVFVIQISPLKADKVPKLNNIPALANSLL
jgi:hypothetical protein